MQTKYSISGELLEQLETFFTYDDMGFISQNLRRMFIDFLDYDLKTGVTASFEEFLLPFNSLLDVLDSAAKDWQEYNLNNRRLNEQSKLQPSTTKEKVIAFLVASLSPFAIFLLHHDTTNNNKQYFDLLVVIPVTSKTAFACYEQVITMANIDDAIINVSLHKQETIQQQMMEGHLYYSIACNKENLVYTKDDFKFPEPNKEALKALAAKATIEFDTAHKKADNFLHGAANFRGDKDNEMTAFMLQQAAELLLRGLIKSLSGTCVKTHYFNELKKPLKRYLPALNYIISTNEAEEERLLHVLEKAYLESRYSNQFIISDADMDLLAEAVELLHERAEVLFKERIALIKDYKLDTLIT